MSGFSTWVLSGIALSQIELAHSFWGPPGLIAHAQTDKIFD